MSTVLMEELTCWNLNHTSWTLILHDVAKEDLRKKILYLETYSRRENLKLAGIPEVSSDQEDTKTVLTNFISRQLGIENPEEIEFQRVHQIGKKGDRPRMVIALFLRFADRERIMRNAYKLKNKDFTMYDDIPKELIDLLAKEETHASFS